MIDLRQLRDEPEKTIDLIQKKDPSFDGQQLYNLDLKLRTIRQEVETLRGKKNELAKAARGGITDAIKEESIEIGTHLKAKEEELRSTEAQFQALYLSCPNLPLADVPVGGKESNKVVKIVGEKPTFSFEPKHHADLAEALDWIDFKMATMLAGSNFALYKGNAVKLLYSLALFMLKNNIRQGYTPILPPVLVNEKSLEVSGNFPKFKEDVYSVPEDGLYLTPTSEVNLANMYRNSIFEDEAQLPLRMTSWTSCFRREAGTYGAHERGLIRIHQFEKVELFSICTPAESADELDRMVATTELILQKLDLHYRISLLAAQDMGFQAAKTYDVEVWLPGQKQYYEVSSCSNCVDFQARRGLMRFKTKEGKNQLVHTLNGSSLALPRLMVALMETYQQADGSIIIPEVLQKEGLL